MRRPALVSDAGTTAGCHEPEKRSRRISLAGVIASAGFASGDRFVFGCWRQGPLGPMSDLMWATPDGERRLLAPSPAVAKFVTSVYRFDRLLVVPFEGGGDEREIDLRAGEVELHLQTGPGRRLPFQRRPAWFTRYVEGPIATRLLGVRTYGVSPTGVREWYRADVWRPVIRGWARVAGEECGDLGPLEPPVGFGFSEPPRKPSIVGVRPLLVFP